MNIYKVLTFDGYSSKQYIIQGYDIINIIQTGNHIPWNHIIKVELIGSEDITDLRVSAYPDSCS